MTKKKEKNTNQQRMKVKLKAYDHRILDGSIKEIIRTVERTGARMVGPIPLPTKIEKWTVLRSPHVDKRSMESFEIRIHKRLFEIVDPTRKTTDALMKLNLPAGVHVEIKI
ncbi:MAG: 30S ribosomal protein S10 [Candidatus Omnitrophica bacterium]|nr:30S ribosomal protein S10 [Candidatus Omnitrophota bacterium]MBU1048160.1 30S ribosomal protein S10 [Candidatus Omnitrophota bacterium]MBU1630310.1 30S ribosomal protein S10 [Candidatus Omnitrophota bacterium]MBU1767393.1 30S ribosomal protein S10 [Candidatus Omnitrophota bacterium]MBU1889255.1 30S ribosomal protein S10 [Candidatus Omnitrophota bacterium]